MEREKDLSDKTIVITGGSSGIGLSAAKTLTQMNSRVVITGRSEKKQILEAGLDCDYYRVDYSKFSEVKKFAASLIEKYPRIDFLINNVGGVISSRRETADGHEQTLQVNHLSGFLLTYLLKEKLEHSEATVINTSSVANTFGKLNFDDLESKNSYFSMKAYGAAKLMNILHAMEIPNRFNGVSSASFHPGVVKTGFAREGSGLIKLLYSSIISNIFLIPPGKGADTLIWLIKGVPGKDWISGEYYHKRRPGRKNPQASGNNAKRLWELSKELLTEYI